MYEIHSNVEPQLFKYSRLIFLNKLLFIVLPNLVNLVETSIHSGKFQYIKAIKRNDFYNDTFARRDNTAKLPESLIRFLDVLFEV